MKLHVVQGYFQYICFMFASSCKHPIKVMITHRYGVIKGFSAQRRRMQILRPGTEHPTCRSPCHIFLLGEWRDVWTHKSQLKYKIKFDSYYTLYTTNKKPKTQIYGIFGY